MSKDLPPNGSPAGGSAGGELLSRKAFLQQGASQLFRWGATFLSGLVDTVAPPQIRPPGALDEPAFLTVCERCDKCRVACPVEAVFPLSTGIGAGTPVIDPKRTPCHLCEDLPCVQACPSGALKPVGRLQVRMAAVSLVKDKCLPYQGTPCELCLSSCPVDGALLQEDGRPVLVADACTGCGCCVFSCPTDAWVARPLD